MFTRSCVFLRAELDHKETTLSAIGEPRTLQKRVLSKLTLCGFRLETRARAALKRCAAASECLLKRARLPLAILPLFRRDTREESEAGRKGLRPKVKPSATRGKRARL